jgi:O-antigen/teichoic acid export membrane protein
MLLVMAGRTTANLMNVLIALAANLSLNLILIPRWGIIGAAVAWAASIVLSNILPLLQIRRSLGLDPFGRASAAVALLAVVAFAGVPSIGWLMGGSPVLVIGLCVMGALLYAAGIWRLRRVLELDSLITPVLHRLR